MKCNPSNESHTSSDQKMKCESSVVKRGKVCGNVSPWPLPDNPRTRDSSRPYRRVPSKF